MAEIRINQLPTAVSPVKTLNVAVDGAATEKVTIETLVNTGRPFATQPQAVAGTDATVAMSPLTTDQAITAKVSLAGRTGNYNDLSNLPPLGTASSLDVGTTAGTVAAGDDTRIVNALQTAAIGSTVQAYSANLDALSGVTPGAAGTSILALSLASDVRSFLDTAPYVATRTAGKALDTSKDKVLILTEPGREGVFNFRVGDYSGQIAADPLEGVYFEADDTPSTEGAWVRFNEGQLNALWFGATKVTAAQVASTSLYAAAASSSAAFAAAHTLAALIGGNVFVPSGVYKATETYDVPSGVVSYGLGTNEAFEIPFFDLAAMTLERGVTIIMTGNGTRDKTIDYCSAMHHSGAYRTNPVRSYSNANDQYFEAADFTNGNASGATKATLKSVSVAVRLGNDGLSGKTGLANLRFVPACDDGTNGPLSGYLLANADNYVAWSEWDVGLLTLTPYTTVVQDCQIVGYWHMKGVVQSSIRFGSTQSGGRGEMAIWQRNWIQGGIAVRNGDFAFAQSKTATSVTVAWWPGHRFNSTGSVIFDSVSYPYTGLVYSSAGEGTLEFTGIASTANIVVSGDDRSLLHLTNNNGTTQTVFRDNNIRDFWHASLVERPSTAFGSQSGKYSAALELAGYPIRGITFENNTIYTREPLFLLMMGARDIYFDKGTYEEKDYRTTLAGSLNPDGGYQGLAIVGADSSHIATWPVLQLGGISINGYPWSGRLNISPNGLAVTGRRYSAFTDCFNPFYFDPGNVYGKGAGIYDRRAPRRYVIASGALTVDDTLCSVDTEGSASTDDLDTITAPLWLNEVTLYSFNSGRITTLMEGGNINLLGVPLRLSGGTSVTLRRSGSSWLLKNQFETRYIEGTAAYAGGAIADGAGVDVFVTVTGAALGDLAVATLNQNLLGCLLTATVTAANTVRVRIQNEAGGSLSPAAGTVRARIYK